MNGCAWSARDAGYQQTTSIISFTFLKVTASRNEISRDVLIFGKELVPLLEGHTATSKHSFRMTCNTD